ncbi:hypothetical protein MLD38_023898 [Melastoma candidum]|uniref:Uncharacterized protein n=1 Tax=Melastoma candidum TaxID=119954 RepID=A0ACB9NSC6_9MYRT|nr:hypothetical protein MLD38_023898 [Melastoma candidum]
MEGLIPFLYRLIVQYKKGEQQPSWSCESPSAMYTRLPSGDSGRIFWPECNFSMSPSRAGTSNGNHDSGVAKVSATSRVIVASGAKSPVRWHAVE